MTLDLRIENYLPPKVLEWAFENHLRIKLVESLPAGERGRYDVSSDEILLDSSLNCEEEGKRLTESLSLTCEPSAVYVALLFHEAGHFFSRKKLDEIGNFKGTDMETLVRVRQFRSDCERDAWHYAIERFSAWTFNMWDQGDYRKWRDNRK